jgi:hypothetical protein
MLPVLDSLLPKSLAYLSVLPKSVCLMTFTSFNPQIILLGFKYTTLVVICNLVLVRKSDGSLRLCIDYRGVNRKTIKDAHSLPRMEDTLDCLSGARFFTKLDLRSAYWQCAVNESDKPKTAFNLGPLGFYEFNRLPFGLTNACSTFQRLMERCMGELHLKECLIYLDDIIIFSKTEDEHIKRLESVFRRLKEQNNKGLRTL